MPGFFAVADMEFIGAVTYAETRGVAAWRGRPGLETLFGCFAQRPSVAGTHPKPPAPPG
jgi:hypothetical protein